MSFGQARAALSARARLWHRPRHGIEESALLVMGPYILSCTSSCRRKEPCWPGPAGGGEEISVGVAAGVPGAGPTARRGSALASRRVRVPQHHTELQPNVLFHCRFPLGGIVLYARHAQCSMKRKIQ